MDVFLSYAAEDRDRAAALVAALQACGWTVWWDRRLEAGAIYDEAIERELRRARCVVVLWSHDSIASEWVRNEAAVAVERGVLVPVRIDAVELPLEFRRKHTADLIDWEGDSGDEGFQTLCAGIRTRTGEEQRLPASAAVPAIRKPPNRRWMAAGIPAVAVLLGFAAYQAATRGPAGLADLIAGNYHGNIVSDSRGGSRPDVSLSITKVAPQKVRITSDYTPLRTAEIEIARSGNAVLSVGSPNVLSIDLSKRPLQVVYNFEQAVSYVGQKQ